uniref:Zisupton n=1 Tax=Elaeophora elaphi TaxID=1147741 RepID=A0A0R3RMX0_9BILA
LQINNSYVDLFIICCKNCRKGSTEEEWRIHLKAQFLIHHYAVVEKFEERLSYEIATRKTEYSAPRICITEDYREVSYFEN